MPAARPLCETQWLQRVLGILMEFRGRDSVSALAELRDQLLSLCWQEGCPSAIAFAKDGDGDRFRRHPLAGAELLGCSALLMYWPPGHATLPHDHGGHWGIEIVLDGALDIDEFVGCGNPETPSLTPTRRLRLTPGEAALFTGARYVHRCRNLSNASPALTLHVYGGVLDAFTTFDRDTTGRLCSKLQTTQTDRSLS
jgi:hypothetical protein